MIAHAKFSPYLLLAAGLSVCFTGCSSLEELPPSRREVPAEIEALSPDILQKYDSFYVAPIDVYSMEGDVLNRVSDREVTDLAEAFRVKIIRQLGSNYSIMSQPAKNVAFIKVAITDVSTNYALLQLRPGLVVPNNARGGASIDAKFVDSV